MTNINDMTRKELDALPYREGLGDKIEFTSMVILPGRIKDMHESGYRCMDFVAVMGEEPICRLSGCSDMIHIDGIGGYGKDWLERYGTVPAMVNRTGWSIDCLRKSGLLRMWPSSRRMTTCDYPSSSFEIYALKREENG